MRNQKEPELRQRAEEKLKGAAVGGEDLPGMQPGRMASLIHELRVHQIELEMQNDELHRVLGELEETRDRYSHLYDFAPVGYFTMGEKGIIEEVNLTGAAMLGIVRRAVVGKPFTRFICREDQDIFYNHRRRLLETETYLSCEVRLLKNDGYLFPSRLECSVVKDKGKALRQMRIVVIDITEQKRAEVTLRESENKLRLLSSQLLSAQEDERKRISLELHDEMGQILTAIGFNLTEMGRELLSEPAVTIREKLEETRSLVERALVETRELSLHLRPPMLDDLGLVPTLRWHLNSYGKRTNIEVEFEVIDLDERLDADMETVLYRIVQEALNNVAKHAEAKKVIVRLQRKEGAIAASIKDNGKGIAGNEVLTSQAPEHGIGLLGMRERVALLGGRFAIESHRGDGTQISMEIPLG